MRSEVNEKTGYLGEILEKPHQEAPSKKEQKKISKKMDSSYNKIKGIRRNSGRNIISSVRYSPLYHSNPFIADRAK